MAHKAARHSKGEIAPISSPFAEFLTGIQSGKLPQSDQLASSIADIQSKLADWKPSGANDPFGFLFDRTISLSCRTNSFPSYVAFPYLFHSQRVHNNYSLWIHLI